MPTVKKIKHTINLCSSVEEASEFLACPRKDVDDFIRLFDLMPPTTQGKHIPDHEVLGTFKEGGLELVCSRYGWDSNNARRHLRKAKGSTNLA